MDIGEAMMIHVPTLRSWRHGLSALLAAAWLVIGTPAVAQDATDPADVQLSAQLLDLAGVKPMLIHMLDQLAPNLTQLIQQANPGKEAQVEEVMNRFVVPKMKNRLPEILEESAKIYARHFTSNEITQLIQFYQSPLGTKLVREQSLIVQEMTVVSSRWAQSVAAEAIREYADEFRKRGLQTPI
jgi:hypothetical protein